MEPYKVTELAPIVVAKLGPAVVEAWRIRTILEATERRADLAIVNPDELRAIITGAYNAMQAALDSNVSEALSERLDPNGRKLAETGNP